MSSRLPGIDVSHWQGVIAWDRVKEAGYQFAYLKATDGDKIADSHFQLNWRASKDAGVLRGAYHFFRPGADFEAQFRNFTGVVEPDGELLPPCLDLEVGPMDSLELESALSWLDAVERFYGVTPVVYCDRSLRDKLAAVPRFNAYPLWIADYSTIEPPLWKFWQHTPQGQVSGVPGLVDLDWFNGSVEDLLQLGKPQKAT
jgi:lysozyme